MGNLKQKYNKNWLPCYGHKCDLCVSIMRLLCVTKVCYNDAICGKYYEA